MTMTFNRRHILKLAAPLMAAALMAAPAHAKPGKNTSKMDMQPAMQQSFAPKIRHDVPKWAQAKISASRAKSIALRRHPGAKFNNISRRGGVYVVRLIKKNGRVVDVVVDAQTGRVR